MEEIQILDFAGMKKKDKKPATKATDKKAEDKKPSTTTGETKAEHVKAEEAKTPEFKNPYTFEFLLERIYNVLKSNNPALAEKKKLIVKPPQVVKARGKRTAWINFEEICGQMRRNPEHVYSYFLAELGTEGSVSGGQLLLKDKYQYKQIESLIRKYIQDYVCCALCKSSNTTLTKDSNTRLYMMKCEQCQSTRSVASIKTGYHAVSKADRKKEKAEAQK